MGQVPATKAPATRAPAAKAPTAELPAAIQERGREPLPATQKSSRPRPTSDASASAEVDPGRDALLRHRHIWQASRLTHDTEPNRIATGHAPLDALLGGWPGDGITEILAERHGIGEVRTLLPALAHLSRQQSRWLCWIAPPHVPFAPALEAAGVDTSRVLLIHPRNQRDLLWAAEQALKGGTCSAVLCWPQQRLRARDVQRLRMAARQGGSWNVLFRSTSEADIPSAADQRLVLRPAIDRLPGRPPRPASDNVVDVRILKRRNGWGTDFFRLTLEGDPRSFSLDHLGAQLERWRQQLRKIAQPAATTASSSAAFRRTHRSDSGAADAPASRLVH